MKSWRGTEPMQAKLAPRITLYPFGSASPPPQDGWLSLAQLPRDASRPSVFGDGSHPTTRLCASVLDLLCRQRRPQALLDVGTGTGVLARIARARGVQFVVGTDIDPVALTCAEAHSALDAHSVRIQFTPEAPDHWGARFDLIVANILEEPLRHLAQALSRALLPGSLLLVSGFTRPQAPALRVFYENTGLTFVRQSHLDEWAMLIFERSKSLRPHGHSGLTAVAPCSTVAVSPDTATRV